MRPEMTERSSDASFFNFLFISQPPSLPDLVHTTFQAARLSPPFFRLQLLTMYNQLLCTLLNISHRKPRKRGVLFCYSGILNSEHAMKVIAPLTPGSFTSDHYQPLQVPEAAVPTAVPLSGRTTREGSEEGSVIHREIAQDQAGENESDEEAWMTVHVRGVVMWIVGPH